MLYCLYESAHQEHAGSVSGISASRLGGQQNGRLGDHFRRSSDMLQLKLTNQPCTSTWSTTTDFGAGFYAKCLFWWPVLHVPRFGRQGLGSKPLQDYSSNKGTREKRTDKRQARPGELHRKGVLLRPPSRPFCTQKRVLPRHVVRKTCREKGHATHISGTAYTKCPPSRIRIRISAVRKPPDVTFSSYCTCIDTSQRTHSLTN
ncbi:hypothetical protein GGI42DRAFT_169687 [Trichoderma sp. SZMC 28013]